MVEKVFRVRSESSDYLSAEMIAFALLRQLSLPEKEHKASFIVIEEKSD